MVKSRRLESFDIGALRNWTSNPTFERLWPHCGTWVFLNTWGRKVARRNAPKFRLSKTYTFPNNNIRIRLAKRKFCIEDSLYFFDDFLNTLKKQDFVCLNTSFDGFIDCTHCKSTEWNFKQKKAAHAWPQALQHPHAPQLDDLRRILFGVKSEDLG